MSTRFATTPDTCARSPATCAGWRPPPHRSVRRPARSSHDRSNGVDADAGAGVVHVALRVPQGRFVLGLRGRRGVPGAYEDLVLSGREVDGDPPLPPGPPAEVVEQLGLRPGRAAVERDVDPRHVPLAAG